MKLYSREAELQALKTICDGHSKISGSLLSYLSPEHFHLQPSREAFSRLQDMIKDRGDIPSYTTLTADPALDEESRSILHDNEEEPVDSSAKAEQLFYTMDNYRKVRTLYEVSENSLKTLQQESVDVEQLLDSMSDELFQARTSRIAEDSFTHFGKGNNSTETIKMLLSDDQPPVIPTGFKDFDSRNGGFFRGSLVTLAGTTGGGKCITGDSRVPTNNGTWTMEEVWKANGGGSEYGWRPIDNVYVESHEGTKQATHMYHGRGKTIRITTESGRSIEGLPEHKIWVVDENDNPTFRRLDEIKEGDEIPEFKYDY